MDAATLWTRKSGHRSSRSLSFTPTHSPRRRRPAASPTQHVLALRAVRHVVFRPTADQAADLRSYGIPGCLPAGRRGTRRLGSFPGAVGRGSITADLARLVRYAIRPERAHRTSSADMRRALSATAPNGASAGGAITDSDRQICVHYVALACVASSTPARPVVQTSRRQSDPAGRLRMRIG